MSRFQLQDSARNVASISTNGALIVTGLSTATISGVQVTSSSLQIIWRGVQISGSSAAIHWPGVEISASAAAVTIKGVNYSDSSVEVWNRANISTVAVSTSTGNIKNGAGLLFGYLGTTGGGQVNFKIDDVAIGAMTVSAGVMVTFPAPIQFNASLSASSSVGVYTVFYR